MASGPSASMSGNPGPVINIPKGTRTAWSGGRQQDLETWHRARSSVGPPRATRSGDEMPVGIMFYGALNNAADATTALVADGIPAGTPVVHSWKRRGHRFDQCAGCRARGPRSIWNSYTRFGLTGVQGVSDGPRSPAIGVNGVSSGTGV